AVSGYDSRARRVVHQRLDEYAPSAWAQDVVELQPELVIAPGTDRGHEVLAHVAATLDLPLAANVVDARTDDDALQLTRQRWGGSLLEEARLTGSPKLITVAPHVIDAEPTGLRTQVEDFAPTFDDAQIRVRVARLEEPETGTIRPATARRVVGG